MTDWEEEYEAWMRPEPTEWQPDESGDWPHPAYPAEYYLFLEDLMRETGGML